MLRNDKMKALRLILGDQLSHSLSTLQEADPKNDIILMCEVMEEATYVKHHKKKIAFLFSAMRHFAEELREKGFTVDYIKLDDEENSGSFTGEVERALKRHQLKRVVAAFPGEQRVLEIMKEWEILPNNLFLSTPEEFSEWAKGRKQLRMEYFYREMRKRYEILMDQGEPLGGEWNYDAENRKPPKRGMAIPSAKNFKPDSITGEVLELVSKRFSDHFGNLEPFTLAVTRKQALEVLSAFILERLAHFGAYQDAMLEGEPWMYHSHISFYLNCGLLHPLECIEAAENAYHGGKASLNAVEGFIRQILGWREYVRGIYWLLMPEYEKKNYLLARRKLPEFFWTGETKMNCLKQCITETKENAYAHHIQRLMVIGNFSLLAGLNPKEVNEWYMIVYADAYQWVELPNVTGMILYADGGILGSKPYAASGAYINKMSNYCRNCEYKVTKKNGEDACPFNYLYWDFLMRNREKLEGNPRLGMMYKTLDRMDEAKRKEIAVDAERFLEEA